MKKKKVSKRKSIKTPAKNKVVRGPEVEKVLFENFISLQNVLADLAIKLDGLTNKVTELVEIFESSAKSLAEKDLNLEKEIKDNEKMMQKMDHLLEQNKIIAKGLTLMHDKIHPVAESEETEYKPSPHPEIPPMNAPAILPNPTHQLPYPPKDQYQKSIGSNFKHIPSENNA